MPDAPQPATRASTATIVGRVRWLLAIFIGGLVLSGVTAIPIEWQLDQLTTALGLATKTPDQFVAGSWQHWLLRVRDGVKTTNETAQFMGYAGDRLAFGHFGIAIVFLWAWRDPVRHRFCLITV
ncbi:MAG: hypothetical protein H7144_07150 [Burkholderiales bacterium]|nr:hypothetical protein [Phycisphaerae bacterium]